MMPATTPWTRPSIGLALGSGVGRGWAHIGVLRALDAAGIRPDVITGTSAGALVGGVYLAGHLDTLADWTLSLTRRRLMRYVDLNFADGGLIGGRRLARLLQENIGDLDLAELPRPFAAIATELNTGHEVWLRGGHLVDSIRASFALPGVFPPVLIDGQYLVDGALTNPLPVSVCRALGARLIIAVNLNADVLGLSRGQALLSGEAVGDSQDNGSGNGGNGHNGGNGERLGRGPRSLLGSLFRREAAPNLFNVMAGSLNILQDRLIRSRLAGDPPDVQIAPRVGHIGLLEFDRAEELIAEGEAATERALPWIEEALVALARAPRPEC